VRLQRWIGLVALGFAATAGAQTVQVMSAADSAALRLVERAALSYASARTLQASFTQTLTNPRTGAVYRATGQFFQHGTTKFAFRFTEPVGDQVVADGETIWLYLPSSAPGQALKLPRAVGAGLDLASSILRDPANRYQIKAMGPAEIDDRATEGVELTARAAGGTFTKAIVWIDPVQALIRRAVITEAAGMERRIDFTEIRVGAGLPGDAFVFTPPPGVRVIDQAALFGGSVPATKVP
jgi:outer membrane lipoprotein carrier protein